MDGGRMVGEGAWRQKTEANRPPILAFPRRRRKECSLGLSARSLDYLPPLLNVVAQYFRELLGRRRHGFEPLRGELLLQRSGVEDGRRFLVQFVEYRFRRAARH